MRTRSQVLDVVIDFVRHFVILLENRVTVEGGARGDHGEGCGLTEIGVDRSSSVLKLHAKKNFDTLYFTALTLAVKIPKQERCMRTVRHRAAIATLTSWATQVESARCDQVLLLCKRVAAALSDQSLQKWPLIY